METKSRSENEIIESIAKKLVEKRKTRGLSLQDVSQALKIRVPLLKDLEKGKWDEIPGGVYLQGFLKQYAIHLGLDPKALLAEYGKREKADDNQKEKDTPESTAERDNHTKFIWISVGMGILLFLGLIRFLSTDSKPVEEVEVVANTPLPEEQPPVPMIEQQQPQEVIAERTLQVFSPYSLWLGVQAEDRSFEGFIPEGTTWSWKGRGDLSVRLGHTKEVSVYLDGERIELREDQKRLLLPNGN